MKGSALASIFALVCAAMAAPRGADSVAVIFAREEPPATGDRCGTCTTSNGVYGECLFSNGGGAGCSTQSVQCLNDGDYCCSGEVTNCQAPRSQETIS